jgi:hypothetical protein
MLKTDIRSEDWIAQDIGKKTDPGKKCRDIMQQIMRQKTRQIRKTKQM